MCGLVITLYGKFTVAYGQLTLSATKLVEKFFIGFYVFAITKCFNELRVSL